MQNRYHVQQDRDEQAAETADKIMVPGTGWCGIKQLPVVTSHFPSLSSYLQVLTHLFFS